MNHQSPIYLVIVAAGVGSRYGSTLPKQFCMLGGRPVLCHAITKAREALPEAHIITVISREMEPLWIEMARVDGIEPPPIVHGGATRWESVKNALHSIECNDPGAIVLIHDAARPLLDSTTARAVVEEVEAGASSIPVLAVSDSLRFVSDDGTSVPVDRSQYRAVVTPQGFMLADLRRAYELPFSPAFTDDASVMAAAGMTRANLVNASPALIKITNPGDIARAESML